MDVQSILESLGIEPKEAKVYLSLLEQGEVTATILAKRTGLDRTLMYQLTNKLCEKGLAAYIIKNNVRYFKASSPETILEQFEQKRQNLQAIFPELKARQNVVVPDTKIEVYRGREGINTILKMIIREKQPYFILGGAQEACSYFKLENAIFVKQAEKENLAGKVIARNEDKFFIGVNEEFRLVPAELITSTTTMMWGNKTAIFVWADPYYAILIDQESITKSNIAYFEYLWKTTRKPTLQDRRQRLLKL